METFTRWEDPSIQKLKDERDTLLNSLCLARQKYNKDKARYRRKAKRYRHIIKELQKFIDLALEIYNEVDVKTLQLVKDKLDELIKEVQ